MRSRFGAIGAQGRLPESQCPARVRVHVGGYGVGHGAVGGGDYEVDSVDVESWHYGVPHLALR